MSVYRIINGVPTPVSGGNEPYEVATTTENGLMSSIDKVKLDGIAIGAEVNVQSDWTQTDDTLDDFIKNKPISLSQFTNDTGFITNTVSDLTSYYLKTETYTQNEVNTLISNIVTFNVQVVQTLPTEDISTHTIYLVPKTGTNQDIYDEYIYINNEWELIGTTQIDLSDYYTKTETDGLLDDKANLTDIPTTLPANGGNADTVDGYHATDFVSSSDVSITSYIDPTQFGLSYEDTPQNIYAGIPNHSIFMCLSNSFTDTSWNFPLAQSILIIQKFSNVRSAITLYNKNGVGVYTAGVDTNGNFVPTWYNIADGGNAISINTKALDETNSTYVDKTYYPVIVDENNGTATSEYLYTRSNFGYQVTTGTTSKFGESQLILGNSIASGTAGNSYGFITLYNRQTYVTNIRPNNNITGNTEITLPATGGTLALNTVATTSANGLMSSADKTKLNYSNIAYGTCDTAADTVAKVVTISGNSNWALTIGSIVTVKFTNTNTATSCTINVNGTGAKSVWYNAGVNTTNSNLVFGVAGRLITYMYDGTYWVWMGQSYEWTLGEASATANGYVSTGTQTFAGNKTFVGYVFFANGTTYYINSVGAAKLNTATVLGATNATVLQCRNISAGTSEVGSVTLSAGDLYGKYSS